MTHARLLPRERLEQRGVLSLSDLDLLSVILGSGIDGKGVLELARSVSRVISRGRAVGEIPMWTDFEKIHGVGKVKAMQVVCVLELGSRLFSRVSEGTVTIRSRSDVKSLCGYLTRRKQEHVVVIAVNARNEYLGKKTVAIGSLNKSIVEPRDVFVRALQRNAAGLVIVHNHPSGVTDLSDADERFTKRITEAGDLLGISLLDSVVV